MPIRHNSFSASIKLKSGPAKGSVLTLSGSFKGSKVSGSFGGSLVEGGKKCSIPKSSFHASAERRRRAANVLRAKPLIASR